MFSKNDKDLTIVKIFNNGTTQSQIGEDHFINPMELSSTPTSTSSSEGSKQQESLPANFHPWPHLSKYIGPVLTITTREKRNTNKGVEIMKGKIRCRECQKNFSFSSDSLFSLKTHFKMVS